MRTLDLRFGWRDEATVLEKGNGGYAAVGMVHVTVLRGEQLRALARGSGGHCAHYFTGWPPGPFTI